MTLLELLDAYRSGRLSGKDSSAVARLFSRDARRLPWQGGILPDLIAESNMRRMSAGPPVAPVMRRGPVSAGDVNQWIHHTNPRAQSAFGSAIVLNPNVIADRVTWGGQNLALHGSPDPKNGQPRQVWYVPSRQQGHSGPISITIGGKTYGAASPASPTAPSSGANKVTPRSTPKVVPKSPISKQLAALTDSRQKGQMDYGSWLRSQGKDPRVLADFKGNKAGYQNYLNPPSFGRKAIPSSLRR